MKSATSSRNACSESFAIEGERRKKKKQNCTSFTLSRSLGKNPTRSFKEIVYSDFLHS